MSLSTAVYDRLVADATLTAMLDTYRGNPAVIVSDAGDVPENVRAPFVIIAGPSSDVPNDSKQCDGREIIVAVRCYTKATGSTLAVANIAEQIRTLLHRQPVGLLDYAYVAECRGPFVAPTDRHFYGRQIDARVLSQV